MRSDVQVVVDRLAEVLGRSVTLRGADEDFVTYSGLLGETDERRRAWILTQGAVSRQDGSLREYLADRPGPLVRMAPGEIQPGSLARVMGVVQDERGVLGGLSVIDGPTPLTPPQVELVLQAAAELSVLMRRDLEAAERRSREQAELIRSVVRGDADARQQAVQSLVDRDLLSSLAPCSVVVTSLSGSASDDALGAARRVLRDALQHARVRYGPHRSLAGELQGEGVLLLVGSSPDDEREQTAQRLHEQLTSRLQGLGVPLAAVVAASDLQPGIAQAHLAHEQAQRVCRVASVVGGFDGVVTSERIGVYDVLAQLPESALTRAVLPAGLQRLLDRAGDSDTLLATLECYLDNAGNAVAAAQQLLIHRGTLYYRLERIEDITGVELRDGMQRVSLHLGLKLARLAGLVTGAGLPPPAVR